ncbi:MAG: NfeD family protein [Treponema sp.]|nr:NfeD family protein [Treponema sp.]
MFPVNLFFIAWFWIILLVVFLVIEACTMALTTIWAAAACVPMIFISFTPLAFRWQLLIFMVLTIALLFFTRPLAVKTLKSKRLRTNVESLAGQEVLLVRDIKPFEKGEAKAKNGVIWTAAAEGDAEIPAGTVCVVSCVEGNTLKVIPKG